MQTFRLCCTVFLLFVPCFSWGDALPSKGSFVRGISLSPVVVKPTHGKNGAAFFSVTNHTPKALKLVGATADVCDHVELHTHLKEGDIYRMRRIEEIVINPGDTLALKPGGLHLMLMQLKKVLRVGDSFIMTLFFEGGKTKTLTAQVQKITSCGCGKNKPRT